MRSVRAGLTVLLVVTGAAATILGIHAAEQKLFPGCGTVPAAMQVHNQACGRLTEPAAPAAPTAAWAAAAHRS